MSVPGHKFLNPGLLHSLPAGSAGLLRGDLEFLCWTFPRDSGAVSWGINTQRGGEDCLGSTSIWRQSPAGL